METKTDKSLLDTWLDIVLDPSPGVEDLWEKVDIASERYIAALEAAVAATVKRNEPCPT